MTWDDLASTDVSCWIISHDDEAAGKADLASWPATPAPTSKACEFVGFPPLLLSARQLATSPSASQLFICS